MFSNNLRPKIRGSPPPALNAVWHRDSHKMGHVKGDGVHMLQMFGRETYIDSSKHNRPPGSADKKAKVVVADRWKMDKLKSGCVVLSPAYAFVARRR